MTYEVGYGSSTDKAMWPVRSTCKYCGSFLPSFAILTQLVFRYGQHVIDYCRKCSPQHADEQLGLPAAAKTVEVD